MPKPVLAPDAREDFRSILQWSVDHFGVLAARRYRALLIQAIRDIGSDPRRAGSRERPEMMVPGSRTYHIALSRHRVEGIGVVQPRHFPLYREQAEGSIDIARILHDSRDLQRHLSANYSA